MTSSADQNSTELHLRTSSLGLLDTHETPDKLCEENNEKSTLAAWYQKRLVTEDDVPEDGEEND